MALSRDDLVHEMEAAFERIGVGWAGWPSAVTDPRLTARERLAALLLVMQVSPARVNGWPYGSDEDVIVRTLPRRSLPWDSDTAVFALEAAIANGCMHYLTGPALRGAEKVIDAGSTDPALHAVLSRCAEQLGEIGDIWGADQDRRHARRLLSKLLPPGLLDLSAIRDGDNWGEPARLAARQHDPDEVEPLVRTLAELGHRSPPQSWQKKIVAVLGPDSARVLVAEWLRSAAAAQEFDGAVAPFVHLLAPSNDDLVRAAVIAARWLRTDEVSAELLGALARRGAATRPPSTDSLAHRVSTAAIDTLAFRATSSDTAELGRLLEDLSRRDLVKKIGAALGPDGAARAAIRDAEIKRDKAIAVRRKGIETRSVVDAEVDRLLEAHVNDTLRELGFVNSGRVWRRFAESRVDVVDFYSNGDGWVAPRYGVLYPALHPKDGPAERVGAKGVTAFRLDLLVIDFGGHGSAWFLDRMAQRLRYEIDPFLRSCGDRGFLAEVLINGTGVPADDDTAIVTRFTGPRLRRKPFPPELALGALACAAGDRVSAAWWLDAAGAIGAGTGRQRWQDELDYWQRRLAELPRR
ncbi:hypothetical protein [Microbacterium sp. K24]|uniref:hypothetical protein n=1 Tax=Microbacterium sp. K24 TaxID=2305446 RepID=UPI00109D294E|nr:hypothetical protein [Microbacterium sp. K24]